MAIETKQEFNIGDEAVIVERIQNGKIATILDVCYTENFGWVYHINTPIGETDAQYKVHIAKPEDVTTADDFVVLKSKD